MNSKLKAGLITVAFSGMCVVMGLVGSYVARFLTPEQFVMGLMVLGVTACLYTIYSVLLAKFQYEEHLKSMVDRK
jgi:O-antigen/teichoic acid export membrane protein